MGAVCLHLAGIVTNCRAIAGSGRLLGQDADGGRRHSALHGRRRGATHVVRPGSPLRIRQPVAARALFLHWRSTTPRRLAVLDAWTAGSAQLKRRLGSRTTAPRWSRVVPSGRNFSNKPNTSDSSSQCLIPDVVFALARALVAEPASVPRFGSAAVKTKAEGG